MEPSAGGAIEKICQILVPLPLARLSVKLKKAT
jgi:hypothetical protein